MATDAEMTLRDDQPAAEWLSALPLGNGTLGAMVFGGTEVQRFQINHGLAWSGSPASQLIDLPDPADSARLLAEIRAQLAAGDYATAQQTALAMQHRHSQAYLPYGDLELKITTPGEISEYGRELNLRTATHREQYRIDGATVTCDSFVAVDPSVLVIKLETTLADGLDLRAILSSPLRVLGAQADGAESSVRLQLPADVYPKHDDALVRYSDDPAAALQGALAMRWQHDGVEESTVDHDLVVRGAHRLTIYLAAETTLAQLKATPSGDADSALAAVRERLATAAAEDDQHAPGQGLHDRHVQTHQELFDRVQLRVAAPTAEVAEPSHRRLLRANQNPAGALATDPGLAELLFNYGRYLLITSSRPGGAPANLQGLWNKELPAPWSSNYTININLEMNYWAAEAVGLTECLEPLFDLIDILQETGAKTAKELYAARGWAAHHNADIWGYSHPVGHGRARPKWALWPMAGFWLVQHLMDHVRFGADPEFVRERAWPAIRGAAEFGLDWLVEMPDGTLGTSPSTSPENSFVIDGEPIDVGVSSTMDLTLIRETFGYLAELAEQLEITADPVVDEAARALPRIPQPTVGRGGQIREWLADDPQFEPLHRHVSHLYFLYPGVAEVTPELEAGASASLDGCGDESTGWSLSWKLALRARLGQAAKVSDLLRLVFRDMTTDRGGQSGGLYANFFAAHPPYQIDGNFGYVAGLVEALLQSHAVEIHLLPALPAELADGEITGLRARGGVTVSMRWRAGALTSAEFSSVTTQTVAVRYADRTWDLPLTAGQPVKLPL